jgi:hypothetical protein
LQLGNGAAVFSRVGLDIRLHIRSHYRLPAVKPKATCLRHISAASCKELLSSGPEFLRVHPYSRKCFLTFQQYSRIGARPETADTPCAERRACAGREVRQRVRAKYPPLSAAGQVVLRAAGRFFLSSVAGGRMIDMSSFQVARVLRNVRGPRWRAGGFFGGRASSFVTGLRRRVFAVFGAGFRCGAPIFHRRRLWRRFVHPGGGRGGEER